MSRQSERYNSVLASFEKYVPLAFAAYVTDLFFQSKVRFKIVASRKTKLGDYRPGIAGKKDQITINGDLNPYSFLITTLHEFAHLFTYRTHQNRVLPHGEEWKKSFRTLLLPVINSGELPHDIAKALSNYLIQTKASSCSDHQLYRTLLRYDQPDYQVILLEDLPTHSLFALNGRQFKKGALRRKRFLCEEISTKKSYLVNALAKVQQID